MHTHHLGDAGFARDDSRLGSERSRSRTVVRFLVRGLAATAGSLLLAVSLVAPQPGVASPPERAAAASMEREPSTHRRPDLDCDATAAVPAQPGSPRSNCDYTRA